MYVWSPLLQQWYTDLLSISAENVVRGDTQTTNVLSQTATEVFMSTVRRQASHTLHLSEHPHNTHEPRDHASSPITIAAISNILLSDGLTLLR